MTQCQSRVPRRQNRCIGGVIRGGIGYTRATIQGPAPNKKGCTSIEAREITPAIL